MVLATPFRCASAIGDAREFPYNPSFSKYFEP
jgi:hypothetical protein